MRAGTPTYDRRRQLERILPAAYRPTADMGPNQALAAHARSSFFERKGSKGLCRMEPLHVVDGSLKRRALFGRQRLPRRQLSPRQ